MADESSCILVAWCLGGNENGMPQSLKDSKVHKEQPKLISVKTTAYNTYTID